MPLEELIRHQFSRAKPTAGNQPPACFHATGGRLIAPPDSQLFCNLKIFCGAIDGPPLVRISDARKDWLLISVRAMDRLSVHLCVLNFVVCACYTSY